MHVESHPPTVVTTIAQALWRKQQKQLRAAAKKKEPPKLAKPRAYAALKAAGLCVTCRREPPEDGRVRCKRCAERQSKRRLPLLGLR
jgi:hypothetical protein